MLFGLVQTINLLDSQSKFQMLTMYNKEVHHIRLYKFAQNISTNISTLGQHTPYNF